MPAASANKLVDAILDAVEVSGYAAVSTTRPRAHPRKFVISDPVGGSFTTWVYAWTLTPGGRTSLPHEYRIQMTGVAPPLALNPTGRTVLLGFEPGLNLFAGFDLRRHRSFTPGSSSVQIDLRVVREALQHGLSFDRKTNDEIAVGIRPDYVVDYMLNSDHLHRYGTQPATLRLLTRATELEVITTADTTTLPEERRRIVQTISRLSRRANFRQQVLRAYDNRCVVTKTQLRLVDAAHILPVGVPDSSDHVTNGLALAPTYHRAFDSGLIYLDESYVMKVNSVKLRDLASLNLHGGLAALESHLGKILLPPDRMQWPNLDLIRKANRVRAIT